MCLLVLVGGFGFGLGFLLDLEGEDRIIASNTTCSIFVLFHINNFLTAQQRRKLLMILDEQIGLLQQQKKDHKGDLSK